MSGYVLLDRYSPVVVIRRVGPLSADDMVALRHAVDARLRAANEKLVFVYDAPARVQGSPNAGVLKEVANGTTLLSPNDVVGAERVMAERKDVAAVILEPIGSSSGIIPTPPEVLGALREITKKHGALLIFDEVVTCFRVAPGGAQAFYGVMPDLTPMAKIVAGGMPGGAQKQNRPVSRAVRGAEARF